MLRNILVIFLLFCLSLSLQAEVNIALRGKANAMRSYAVSQLRAAVLQLERQNTEAGIKAVVPNFVLGPGDMPEFAEFAPLTNDGYSVKTLDNTVYIGADTDTGLLYGVYSYLEACGIGFYLDGDQYPQTCNFPAISQSYSPRQSIRGILPWTNFPQSATDWSMEDYRFIIDQMAKMKLNFLEIHNYNGMGGHNEMFHNFTLNGRTSRTFMAGSKTGHGWQMPPYELNNYRFGLADVFSDYTFGPDCSLHNEGLSNEEASLKGIKEFSSIIKYAHLRGVKIGLGIEFDPVMPEYDAAPDDPELIRVRADQIISDYPDLDYLLFYRSEIVPQEAGDMWEKIFYYFYNRIKSEAPGIKMAVSGWGLVPESIEALPTDVICAPIAPYTAGFEQGRSYGTREYWGCPWLERDFNSSVYYYPYNMHLSETIKCYNAADENMTGFLCLTWRTSDVIAPKLQYIAKAPWSALYQNSRQVYAGYAMNRYGSAPEELLDIIDENEAVASLASECELTAELTGKPRPEDRKKAAEQLSYIREFAQSTPDYYKASAMRLQSRFEAVKEYIQLDEAFNRTPAESLSENFAPWAQSFARRATDTSGIGNIVSSQNRYINLRYEPAREAFSKITEAPTELSAKRAANGVLLSWNSPYPCNIYRDGIRINDKPVKNTFTDSYREKCTYTAAAVTDTHETPMSEKAVYDPSETPVLIVTAPPQSVLKGEAADITLRVFAPSTHWSAMKPVIAVNGTPLPMVHRGRNTFSVRIPSELIGDGADYEITLDGQSVKGHTDTYTIDNMPPKAVECPVVKVQKGLMQWNDTGAYTYRVYRSKTKSFSPAADLLTYTAGCSFVDMAPDFEGQPLNGTYYYRVSSLDSYGRESAPSVPVRITYGPGAVSMPKDIVYAGDTQSTGTTLCADFAAEGGCCVGYFGEAVGDSIIIPLPRAARAFVLRYSSTAEVMVTVYADGKKHSRIKLPNTGGWTSYKELQLDIPADKNLELGAEKEDCDENANQFILNFDRLKLQEK